MSLATRIGEEFNLVRDEGMARLNALAPYNGIIGTDTKQQQENLVFRTTVGNEYKLADTSRFRKIDGKVIDTLGTQKIDFSRNGQHPFEVYTNKALTAPNAVLAGDYVVVDNPELVTNGTFDTDISGWSAYNSTLSIVSGELQIVGNGAIDLNGAYQQISTVIGAKYKYSIDLTLTSANRYIRIGLSQGSGEYADIPNESVLSNNVGTFIAISTVAYIKVATRQSQTVRFDNISVKLVYDTYRATRDSSEMYDSIAEIGIPFSVAKGEVTKFGDGFTNALGNHFYKRLGNALSNYTPVTAMNIPSSDWLDLGTAENMSLQNPYFETRDYISNQVLAMQKADGTIHTETLFVDAYAVETTNAILTSNGWSKLENGLYSKGDVVGTPVGYTQL